ncbi:MAG TPA: DUF4157 domain-containing protein [Dyella sp.]|uniref:eCIS core domain-containing protein n=1 Tax=Dyella sp. TaxID=1869338 RepID=UPI002F944CAD
MLQRKCACGTHAPGGGECAECKKHKNVQAQAKLGIGAPDDAFERQADSVADAVMRGAGRSMGALRDAPAIRRVSSGGGTSGGVAPSHVEHVLAGAGQPLDAQARAFMEPRFRQDFSAVRVHTDTQAGESARGVGALAYTVGNHVVFGSGQYQPHTDAGRRLLAHELTHVLQQNEGVVRRTPDPAVLKEFDERAARIKKDKVLLKQPFQARQEVEQILAEARKRDDPLYYAGKLEELLATKEQSAEEQAKETSAETKDAADAQASRASSEAGKAHAGDEEAVSRQAGRVFTKAKAPGGELFEIDKRDVANIAVKVKVHLIRAGKGTKDDVERVKSMEDAIEKRSATLGYSVDLDFVEKSGPDVFDVKVDTSQWTVSDNWVGDDAAMAHELHHRLGLEEDRYNYIEAHATNEKMHVADRIHWFLMELNKKVDNNPNSIMNDNVHSPLDDDVCRVAGKKSKVDLDACVQQRTDARNKVIGPPLGMAAGWAFKAFGRLSGLQPASPFPPEKGEPTTEELIQRRAAGMAGQLFGGAVPMDRLADHVGATRMELVLWNLQLVSALIEGCDSSPTVSQQERPRIRLCPEFLRLGQQQQAQALLREAFHVTGIGGNASDKPCVQAGCGDACGDTSNAEAWVRFTRCVAEI